MRKLVAATLVGFAALSLSACASVPSLEKAVAGHGSLADPAHARGVNARLSPDDIQAAVASSVSKASAFHVRGTVDTATDHLTVDIHYGKSSSSGLVETEGTTVRFRYAQGVIYFNGTDSYWRSLLTKAGRDPNGGQGRRLVRAAHGKWVIMGRLSEAPADVRSVVTPTAVVQDWAMHRDLKRGPNRVVRGVPTISFILSGTQSTTVFVPADGRALPLRVEASVSGAGIDFDHWNKPYKAKRPSKKQTVDLG